MTCTRDSPRTLTGEQVETLSPVPSCPKLFAPKEIRREFSVIRRVCDIPQDIYRIYYDICKGTG